MLALVAMSAATASVALPGQRVVERRSGPLEGCYDRGTGSIRVVASFDRVRNLPCTRGGVTGFISVGYAADGTATIRCNVAGRVVASQCAALPHASSSCDSGSLAVASCDEGFADVDRGASNGCE